MRTSSVTAHTFWQRAGSTTRFDYWLARGFCLGALWFCIIAASLFTSQREAFGQNRQSKGAANPVIAGTAQFEDHFNGTALSANWSAHTAFKVQNGQLVNSAVGPENDHWDHYLAISKSIASPNVAKIVFGSLADETARAFTGIAMRLQIADTLADGYLIHHYFDKVRLWTLNDGVPGPLVDEQVAARVLPDVGDTLMVEFTTDETGHHFRVLINGKEDAIVSDPDKQQGNAQINYAGVMVNGNLITGGKITNGVDYFFAARTIDNVPPGAVTDLAVVSASASGITLGWKAPGDDDNDGKAQSYDLRYSTAPINDGNFGSATPVNPVPNPANAGTMQNATVGGLENGTTYFFALKAKDAAGNESGLSNVASGTTIIISVVVDDFNRAGPQLGSRWKADPNLQIVGSKEVQNKATADVWSIAMFDAVKNPAEVSMKWGTGATAFGTNWCGLLLMATGEAATANGYMIQYSEQDNKTRLWHILNGNFDGLPIDEGQTLAPPPKAGSVMRVAISSDAQAHRFQVFIDGQPDRTLTDEQKLEGAAGTVFGGFILNSTLNEQNAIDQFSAATTIGSPAKLEADGSTNGQIGSIGEQLAEPLRVTVTDSAGNPVPNVPITFEVIEGEAQVLSPSAPDGNIRIEGEMATISGPIEARPVGDASGGRYIVYPNEAFEDGAATFKVNITQAGTYRIWTRSFKPGSPPGSWTMQVDGGADFTYDVFRGNIPDNWQWDLVAERGFGSAGAPEFDPKTYNWQPGEHTITFKARFADTWLDKILVTSDAAFVPSGKEELGFSTDKNGVSSAVILLGQKAGLITIRAKFGTLAPVTFTARATGGQAAKIALTSGNGQTGAAGQQLAQPFVVTVRDANDNLVANYPVDWMVTEGNGKLTAYRSLTGLNGQAQTFLILGNQGPTNKVEVRAALPGTLPAFTATTLSGIATAASIVSGNAQSAAVRTALLNLLVVKVADGNGGGVANYPVEFVSIRGGGTASAVNRVANPGFESVVNGTTVPGIWKLEGTPSVAEVSGSTDGPRSGSRSLNVTATRSGVGVSQTITYPANSSFTLSFYAKVISGTARVTWQMAQDQTIDMTAASTKSAWQFYTIYASSGATAGAKTLSFKTNGTGNFFIDDIKILPNTGANGQASITWTMGDTAMVQQGRVNVLNGANGNLTGAPLNFSATARAGPAAAVKKQSGDNQAGAASQPLPVPFVAKVSDVTGINGVTNVDVTFEVTAGGKLPGNLTKQTVKSDASGLASTTLTLGPQTGVPNTVKVSIPNVTQTETFTAIAAVPGRIAKGASAPTFGSAGKKMATALTVQVFDTDNKRVAGFPVTFTVKSGGGSINGGASAVIPTDINGEAKAFPVLGPNPGAANRIEASVTHNNAPVTNSPLVFIVTAVRLKTITLVSGNNQPGGVVSTALPQPLKVKLADSLGAGIKDQNVIFTVAAGNGKVNGVTPATVKTDSAGVASATWTLGPTPGTNNNRVQATTNPALTGAPIIFQASAVAGQASNLAKVSRDSASSVVNGTMPLTVKTVDVGGNPKADVNVVFTVKSGGGKVNGTASATVKSQANGQATVTLTLGPTSGAFVNVIEASAQFNNKPLTGSPITYRITGTSSKAASLASASGNRQTGQAGEKLPKQITIKVIDGSNNGVVNHPVTFRISRGEGHFGTPNVTEILVQSDATGFAKANWHLGPATKPDSQIVMAISTDGVNNLRNVPFRFVAFANPGPPNAEASFVQAIPSTITADGVARSQVKVYVRDRYGNGIKGATVTIDVSGEGTRVTQPAMPTDANGVAEGSFTSTRAENKNVTARVISATPIDVTRGANVRVTPLTAQSLIQGGGNGQTGNVNTSLPAPLVVKVGDRFGNGVPGYEVRYKVEQGGGKVQDPASGELLDSLRIRTDEEGFVRVSYVCGSTTTENQIRVLANGLSNSPFLFLAQVRNAPAAKLELGGGNNQVGTVGAMLAKPIAVKVLDNNNRPVSGVPVRFSISLGNGAINEQSIFIVASDAFGEAKVAWRLGPEAGLNVLRAEAPGLANSPIDFQAEASPDRAAAIRFVGNNPVFGNVNGQSEPLTVQAVDVLNNGVAGIGVIFELVEGTGRLTENYVVTGDGGYAAVRAIFDAKSGPRKVRVSSEGLLGSPIIVIAYAQPSGAVSIEAVPRSNNQSGTKGIPVNFPLQVKVFDDLNNPVPGVQVQFVVTLGGGNFGGNGFTNAVSDSAGIASAMWTLGNSAGPNQAKANKNGLAGSPVTFNATAVDNNFPVIADVEDVRSRENDVIRFSVSATDADGDPFTYSALSVPSGASFDVQTRTFTWQTGLSSAGHYEVSFLARDNRGGVDEEVVSIDIANLNQPPFIQRQVPADRGFTTPDTVINNGNVAGKFMMHVFAIDSDQDKLSYRWYRDGIFTGVFGNSYEFVYNAVTLSSFYNVEVLVFDAADTVRVTWLIKVPVELSSFSAAVVENQRVLLSWKTETEQDNAGFNVLRSPAKQGKYEKLNAKLIPARRDGEYEFIDEQIDAGGKYYYKLESVDLTGRGQLHGPVMVEMSAPQSFVLNQNYPNPFNPSTHIRFELPKAAPITLSVYNSLGQEVRRLVNTQKPAGYHTVVWNGRDQQGKLLPSGIYHYRIQAGDFVATKKMVLAK